MVVEQPFTASENFPDIFNTHKEAIRRYILSLVRHPAEAEDLTQETFLRAYNNLHTLKDPGKLTGWLYRIATHICYDKFRLKSHRNRPQSLDAPTANQEGEGKIAEPEAAMPRLDFVIQQKEMSDCVQQYLEDLSDSYRGVILLHDIEGLTNPEIAAMLDCSLDTVKIRLHRARQKLKERLDRGCDFSHDQRDVLVCDPKPATKGKKSA
jgi:RNA polymerase sigma-70 factor (ECF subfamily)